MLTRKSELVGGMSLLMKKACLAENGEKNGKNLGTEYTFCAHVRKNGEEREKKRWIIKSI